MSYLMDDHRDQSVLGGFAVRTIFFWTRTIEADHRILHSVDRAVDADRYRVGIVKGVPTIDFQRVGNRFCAVLAP